MSREMLVVVRCDRCRRAQTNAEDTTLTEVVLTLDLRKGPRRLDLCGPCEEELLGPVRKVVEEYGTAPSSTAPGRRRGRQAAAESPDRMDCPLCDAFSPNRKALSQHLRTGHGKRISEAVAEGLVPAVPSGRRAAKSE